MSEVEVGENETEQPEPGDEEPVEGEENQKPAVEEEEEEEEEEESEAGEKMLVPPEENLGFGYDVQEGEGEYLPYDIKTYYYPDEEEVEEETKEPIVIPQFAAEEEEWEETEGSYTTSSVSDDIEVKALRAEKEVKLELYKQKLGERQILRRRNAYLQKKLVEHFKNRKMDHVLKEDATKGLDQEAKYLKRLYAFFEVKEQATEEKEMIAERVKELKNKVEQLSVSVSLSMDELIQEQLLTASKLVNKKTGKKINEQAMERLINRQIPKAESVSDTRLKYIKLKNKIRDKESILRSMESFGEGLHLIDYEQLKIDSQNLADKLEEREDELNHLRGKTTQNIQNIAHVREKAFAIEGDIEYMTGQVENVSKTHDATREQLTALKKERDDLRKEYQRLKEKYGLLTNDMLLREFQESLEKAQKIEDEIKCLQESVRETKQKMDRDEKMNKTKFVSSYVDFKFPYEVENEKKNAMEKQNENKKKIKGKI